MSAMKAEVHGEAIIDIVKPETLVSDPVIIKVRGRARIYHVSTALTNISRNVRVGHLYS